jgi:hypothetical protein
MGRPKNRKTQQDRQNTENDIQEEQRPSRLTRSSPLTRLYTESSGILQMLKFQKGIFPY